MAPEYYQLLLREDTPDPSERRKSSLALEVKEDEIKISTIRFISVE